MRVLGEPPRDLVVRGVISGIRSLAAFARAGSSSVRANSRVAHVADDPYRAFLSSLRAALASQIGLEGRSHRAARLFRIGRIFEASSGP